MTTAATIVGAVFGLAALGQRGGVQAHASLTIGLIMVSLIALLVAAGFGAFVNRPEAYAEVGTAQMRALVEEAIWNAEDAGLAGRRVAESEVLAIDVARAKNAKKATWLTVAITSEVLGLIVLVGGAGEILLGR